MFAKNGMHSLQCYLVVVWSARGVCNTLAVIYKARCYYCIQLQPLELAQWLCWGIQRYPVNVQGIRF